MARKRLQLWGQTEQRKDRQLVLTFQSNGSKKADVRRERPLYMYDSGKPERLLQKQGDVLLRNGISSREARAFWNGAWLTKLTTKHYPRSKLILGSLGDDLYELDYAERWRIRREIQKFITKLQGREELPQYSAFLIEMLPSMHFHFVSIGNDKVMDQLQRSGIVAPYAKSEKALQFEEAYEGDWRGWCVYLFKEATHQAIRGLSSKGIPLPKKENRKPPISADYAGDRISLSEQLRKDAAAFTWSYKGETVPLIPEYQQTHWKQKEMVRIKETTLSKSAQKKLLNQKAPAEGIPPPVSQPIKPEPVTSPKPAGQLVLFAELNGPIDKLIDFTSGILSPSVSLELEYRRKRLGYSQRGLGQECGLSQSQIANVLAGRFGLSARAARNLKAALGIAA